MTESGALVDATGVQHDPAGPDARIVCLVPSVTELLCDLGLAASVVGRTGFCIHPRDAVARIPKVGGTKDVKLDRVRELSPTHVLLNVDENRLETARELARFVPSVVVTHPQGPLDNLVLYRLLGGIFGRIDEAEKLCNALTDELRAIRGERWPARDVLYLIWKDPWMTVSRDTYVSRTLRLVGWRTVPAAAPIRYPEVDLAALAEQAELVLLSSEPYRFRKNHLPEVKAVSRGARVLLIDGEMTSWYGSRAIRGVRYLAELARMCAGSGG